MANQARDLSPQVGRVCGVWGAKGECGPSPRRWEPGAHRTNMSKSRERRPKEADRTKGGGRRFDATGWLAPAPRRGCCPCLPASRSTATSRTPLPVVSAASCLQRMADDHGSCTGASPWSQGRPERPPRRRVARLGLACVRLHPVGNLLDGLVPFRHLSDQHREHVPHALPGFVINGHAGGPRAFGQSGGGVE
jgi:hypothetical protein